MFPSAFRWLECNSLQDDAAGFIAADVSVPSGLGVVLERFVCSSIEEAELCLVLYADIRKNLSVVIEKPVVVVKVYDEIRGLCPVGPCIQLQSIELDGRVRLPA